MANTRFDRLNYAIFTNVIWIFEADDDGLIKGIKPVAQYGEECTAFFMSNEFKIKGSFTKGALINSDYSSTVPGNIVFLNFHNCKYDARFGSSAYPNTNIISAMERGTWRIKESDFGIISTASALRTNPLHTDVDVQLL